MKRLNLLLILLIACSIGWINDAGWQDDTNLQHRVVRTAFSISKTHTSTGATSGDSVNLGTIPANSLLEYIVISCDTPAKSSGGGTSLNLAVGSAAQADTDITDATDINYLVASGAKTAKFMYGTLIANYDTTNFATSKKSESYYLTEDTTLYMNYLITGDTGATTTATGRVFLIYETLK